MYRTVLITAVLSSAIFGCAEMQQLEYQTTRVDQQFGNAVKDAIAKQTLNPNAHKNTNPVVGMDGIAARNTITTYQQSFKAPEPTENSFTIGVGK